MSTQSIIVSAILPIFLIVGSGYFARRMRWLTQEADTSLLSVVFNLLYPCFIFSRILGNEALHHPANIFIPPLIGFVSIVTGFYLAMFTARRFGLGNETESRTFAYTTGIYNFGYFAIPVIIALFDNETLGVLLVHNIGVEIAVWMVGVGFILTGHQKNKKPAWRRVLNPVVISIIVALVLNGVGAADQIPPFVIEAITQLGNCAIPLGILLIGATMADLAKGIRIREKPEVAIAGTVIRILLLPAAFIALAAILPVSAELKRVMVVQAAMPCGVAPVIVAKHFGGSPETALRVVLPTIIVSLVSIPLWIGIGIRIVGL